MSDLVTSFGDAMITEGLGDAGDVGPVVLPCPVIVLEITPPIIVALAPAKNTLVPIEADCDC